VGEGHVTNGLAHLVIFLGSLWWLVMLLLQVCVMLHYVMLLLQVYVMLHNVMLLLLLLQVYVMLHDVMLLLQVYVMLHNVMLLLQVYVDGTLGAGGHMEAMLQQHKVLHTQVHFAPTASRM
jgi:hypothetical protein